VWKWRYSSTFLDLDIRRIFESKRKYVNLYSSPGIIRMTKSRRMKWAGHAARIGKRNAYMILVGKPKGKRPLGRPRCRWVDITVGLKRDRMVLYGLD
jgi:hypothetical protein